MPQIKLIQSPKKSTKLIAFLSSVLLSVCSLSHAQTIIPSAPEVNAKGHILIDYTTGKVIAESNADILLAPASLTKMMTSYIIGKELVSGNIKNDDIVKISEKAWAKNYPGSSLMYIEVGTEVPVSLLNQGIIVASGNDACVAMAEHIAGSERAFADLMNQHARRLGMTNTNYENATGLPSDNQYASAYDLAILARALITDSKQYYPIYTEKHFEFNDIRQPNRNRLLWRDDTVDGIKTGHTDEAGYCLVSSAVRDGMRLISVVMGSASEETRAQETQQLLAYTYRFYESTELYAAGQSISDQRVWGGEVDNLSMGVLENLSLTLPRGQQDRLEVLLDLPRNIQAPVAVGDAIGSVVVSLDGEVISETPLVALHAVEPGSFFKRLWHSILQFFMNLIN